MKRIKRFIVIFLTLIFIQGNVARAEYDVNPFVIAMRLMLDMLDGNTNYYRYYRQPYNASGFASPFSAYRRDQLPNPVYTRPTPFDGIWENESGGVLMVKGQIARLYGAPNDYWDFYVRFEPNNLIARDANTGEVFNMRMEVEPNSLTFYTLDGRSLTFYRSR